MKILWGNTYKISLYFGPGGGPRSFPRAEVFPIYGDYFFLPFVPLLWHQIDYPLPCICVAVRFESGIGTFPFPPPP